MPQTKAHLRVTTHSWPGGFLAGEVRAGDYEWQFHWNFRGGNYECNHPSGDRLFLNPWDVFWNAVIINWNPVGIMNSLSVADCR